MGKKCSLKRSFICFNVILGLIGLIVLILLAVAHAKYHESEKIQTSTALGFALNYVIASVAILLSILGVYGASAEKKWALITFLTLATLSCIGLLVIGVPLVRASDTIPNILHQYMDKIVPLDKASEHDQEIAEAIQIELQCCGYWRGYKDWGSKIPDSCLCPTDQPADCETVEQSIFERYPASSQDVGKLVYKQKCSPLIFIILDWSFVIILAINFGFFALLLLLSVLCVVMLYQRRTRHPPRGPVVFVR